MQQQPLKLSDSELDVIMAAAAPLDPGRRHDFLQAVAAALAHHRGEIGVGVVHRVCAEVQPKFFSAPARTNPSPSKYDRVTRRSAIEA
jgi:hypothetical protein